MPYSGELARDKQEAEVAVAEEERVRGRGWDQHDQHGQDRHGQAGQGSQREGEGEAEMRVDNVCSTALKLQYVNDFMILCYCNGCSLKHVILVSSGDCVGHNSHVIWVGSIDSFWGDLCRKRLFLVFMWTFTFIPRQVYQMTVWVIES